MMPGELEQDFGLNPRKIPGITIWATLRLTEGGRNLRGRQPDCRPDAVELQIRGLLGSNSA